MLVMAQLDEYGHFHVYAFDSAAEKAAAYHAIFMQAYNSGTFGQMSPPDGPDPAEEDVSQLPEWAQDYHELLVNEYAAKNLSHRMALAAKDKADAALQSADAQFFQNLEEGELGWGEEFGGLLGRHRAEVVEVVGPLLP